jgi:hypothetical protein
MMAHDGGHDEKKRKARMSEELEVPEPIMIDGFATWKSDRSSNREYTAMNV